MIKFHSFQLYNFLPEKKIHKFNSFFDVIIVWNFEIKSNVLLGSWILIFEVQLGKCNLMMKIRMLRRICAKGKLDWSIKIKSIQSDGWVSMWVESKIICLKPRVFVWESICVPFKVAMSLDHHAGYLSLRSPKRTVHLNEQH